MTDRLMDDLQMRVNRFLEEIAPKDSSFLQSLREHSQTLAKYGLDITDSGHYQLLQASLETHNNSTSKALEKIGSVQLSVQNSKDRLWEQYSSVCEHLRHDLLDTFDHYQKLPREERNFPEKSINASVTDSYMRYYRVFKFSPDKIIIGEGGLRYSNWNENKCDHGLFSVHLRKTRRGNHIGAVAGCEHIKFFNPWPLPITYDYAKMYKECFEFYTHPSREGIMRKFVEFAGHLPLLARELRSYIDSYWERRQKNFESISKIFPER